MAVVTAKSHRLASRDQFGTADLLDEPIVGYPKRSRPILHEMLWQGFCELGRQPNIIREVIDKSTLRQFVLCGLGIALAPAWLQSLAPPGLSFVPFEFGESRIELCIAFRSAGNNEIVCNFVDDAKGVARGIADSSKFDL